MVVVNRRSCLWKVCWVDTVDNQGSPIEEKAGHFIRMWRESVSCKYAVEYETRVW